MNDEKKTYSVIGTVTIGADEYRDLIEEVASAKDDAKRRNDEYWSEYRRANELKTENEKLREAVNKQMAGAQKLRDFIYANDQRITEYKMFLADLVDIDEEEEDE